MDSLLIRLIEVIRQEIATFERLLAALEGEQKALMGYNTEYLQAAVDQQKGITETASHLERERVEIVSQLAVILQEEQDVLTLKRLTELVATPYETDLRELRETLIALQEEIQKTNRQNTLLIKQSMKYVDKSLQSLAGGSPAGGVYAQSGKVGGPSTPGRGVVNEIV